MPRYMLTVEKLTGNDNCLIRHSDDVADLIELGEDIILLIDGVVHDLVVDDVYRSDDIKVTIDTR